MSSHLWQRKPVFLLAVFLICFHWARTVKTIKLSSEFGTYRLCEQRRFRRACASAQSRQNLRYSLIQAVSQEEPSDRNPDPWPLWMAGHAQLKFVMTECSKTQIRLTRPILCSRRYKLQPNSSIAVQVLSEEENLRLVDCFSYKWASWENLSYANNNGGDQAAHPHSLISAFVVRCLDSIMTKVAVNTMASHWVVSEAEQTRLNGSQSCISKERFFSRCG